MGRDGRFSVAAYAVVANERDEVLLTRRRDGGEWVLPGGSVEEGEAPWEAVAREVREESGLEIGDVRLVGIYAKRREHDLVLMFTAPAVRGVPRRSEERDRVVFVDPDQLPDETSDRDRDRIRDAVARHESPVLAVQPSEADEPPPGIR
jgi:8-oxo-dGTP pyrophosphatase MutT (NUDIX family)